MFSSSKPYTAVTVHVERLSGSGYDENDIGGIPDLVEAIRLQSTGPTEAARAIRKKLKYGNTHQQLRALTILDGLIQNAGGRFQQTFADEPLLERLRILPRDVAAVDPAVRDKCGVLYRQWASRYGSEKGMSAIASLYKDLPKKSRPTATQSKVLQENERDLDRDNPFADDDDSPPPTARRKSSLTQGSFFASSSPSSSLQPPYLASQPTMGSRSFGSSKRDKKGRRKPFSLDKEKSSIMQAIAASSVASTNLLNSLKHVNRETTRVSESQDVMNRFEACKALRRQILRYIQLVESDQWIGSLLSANDELVKALMAFEVMDKSVDDDSDSDVESEDPRTQPSSQARKQSKVEEELAGLNFAEKPPPKPPRPGAGATPTRPPPIPSSSAQRGNDSDGESDEVDENDPFGDQHEI